MNILKDNDELTVKNEFSITNEFSISHDDIKHNARKSKKNNFIAALNQIKHLKKQTNKSSFRLPNQTPQLKSKLDIPISNVAKHSKLIESSNFNNKF